MVSDVAYAVALLRVRIQDTPDQVLALGAEELWHRVVSRHDLLVKITRLRVLEGQITTDHGIKHDTRGPDVCAETMIPLACNHLGGCIARRTTGRLERGTAFVHVGEAEVDNLQGQIIIKQQVLRL